MSLSSTMTLRKSRATRYDCFLQVSAGNSADEADRIDTNETVSMRSTVIFSSHVFLENGRFVHVKLQ